MKSSIVIALLFASAVYAAPAPYTVNTKTGLTRAAERNLYDAVRGMVAPVARWMNLNNAEEECANATAAEALIKATREAQGTSPWGLPGADAALNLFRKSQDDWCNKEGGIRGAREIATRAERAKSFMRPFLQERFEELRASGTEVTPERAAAAVLAALAAVAALPYLAPL